MYKKEKQNMPKRKNIEMALHPKPCDDDDNHIASDDGHSTDEEDDDDNHTTSDEEDDDDNHTTSDEEDDNADDADDLEQMTDAVWKVSNDMVRLARKSDKHRLYRPDEYITRGRIVDMFVMQNGRCAFYCGRKMLCGAGVNRKTCPDAVSLERVDSKLAHTSNNCILACIACNLIKKDHISFEDMCLWAARLRAKTHARCYKCKRFKHVSDMNRKGGYTCYSGCKACKRIYNADYRRRHNH